MKLFQYPKCGLSLQSVYWIQNPLFPISIFKKEVSANALLNGRKKINEHLNRRGPEEFKVSVNDLIMHACAHTIGSFPEINSSWHETEIHMHGQVNLAFGLL